MATEQVTVIEGDGSSDSVTVTDDPVEDATVQAVKNAIGDEGTAAQEADSTVPATLLERVTTLVDALTSGQADDELRVALAADLLVGNLDVDIANQSSGDLTVELAADSLTGNLDVDLAAQTSGALDVSGATVPTEQQTPIQLESSTGTNIDPATEQTVSAIKTAAQALDDALASTGTDEIRVTTPSPIDASAAEIDVDLNSQTLTNVSVDLNAQSGPALDVSGATVTVTDDGALTLAANDGTDIGDVGLEDISPVTGQATKSGSLPVTLASDEDTVSVQEDTALDVSGAEVDVNLNSQSLQNVSVDLASDSLANPLDVDIASASAEPLDVSASTVQVQEDTALDVSAAEVDVDLNSQSGGALDVSAAEVDVDLASQTGPALDVSGATVDVQEASALDVSAATVSVQEASALDVSASTVPVEQQLPVGVEDSTGTQIDPASNPEIRGGASLQTVVDAVEQSALAQISELEGASLQDVVDAVVDAGLALAVDHPAETRTSLDVSSGVTIGPVPVQRAADIAVAANPTGGGDVSVTVDHTDADGNLFVSDSLISGATSASKGTVPRHGTHVRIDLSGTDTSVNFHLDTHE